MRLAFSTLHKNRLLSLIFSPSGRGKSEGAGCGSQFFRSLLLVVFLLLGLQQALAESAVGVVSEVTGTVRIARAGAQVAVTNGTAVLPWDNLTAEAQSSLTINFNKGGAVALEGPLEFLVDVSDNLEPLNSRPAELLRKLSGESVSTFKASTMGLRAERTRFAFESFGAIGGLHPRRKREHVGAASQVMGIVHVTKPSSITIVKEGTPIDAGDELTTDTGASLTLITDDGSAIDLADRSQFAAGILTDPPDPELLRDRSSFSLTAGSACLRLSKRFLESWPRFSVLTPNANVGVKARKLAIKYSNRSTGYAAMSTEVTVAEGTASVSNRIADDKIVEVGAGYTTTVKGTSAPSSPSATASPKPCRP